MRVSASFFFPVSFKLDAADNLWVLDVASARVVVLDPAGRFVRQADLPEGTLITDIALDASGTLYAVDARAPQLYVLGGSGFKRLGKPLRDSLSFPGFLTVTAQGPIVVVDKTGHGLVLLARDGSFLGRRLAIGWTEGLVYYPGQVCIDGRGNAFVADRGNHRLQAFTPGK